MTLAAEPLALDRATARLGTLAVPAMASIGAGVIHAAAIGTHSEHRSAVLTFTGVAAFQLAWGLVALVSSKRWLALVGIAGAGAAVAGWLTAKVSGLPIAGLDAAETPQLADTLAAGFALVVLVLCIAAAVDLRPDRSGPTRLLAGGAAFVVFAASLTGMASAGSHRHAGSHDGVAGGDHGHDGVAVTEDADHDDEAEHHESAVAAKPFKVDEPIDLGGVDGVTPQQQAAAENLLAHTLLVLPKWSDPAVAEAAGFRSIGDGFTGTEHLVHHTWRNDDVILDPNFPESLVYDTRNGQRKLVAAMYMVPPEVGLDEVPELGGKLTQWHIHNNLCYTPDPEQPLVRGITDADGNCAPPLVKGSEQPMIHVWIDDSHPSVLACGPFSALEGVGGGQVKEGEEKWCDHAH